MKSNGMLILVRHGQSEWNKKNLFTGWKDPDLTKKGVQEANSVGKLLLRKKIKFHTMFTSDLIRAQQTGEIILKILNQENIETIRNKALNERDYGDLSGLNKDEAKKRWGKNQVQRWRRSFDEPPPGGESLKETADRVIPFFKKNICPFILEGKNILITAHGNSLRALIMYLKSLNPIEVIKLEIATGQPIAFSINPEGKINQIEI
jgi:2,3-bisphosphoglycerate-dependent phosphoglycerate mutase